MGFRHRIDHHTSHVYVADTRKDVLLWDLCEITYFVNYTSFGGVVGRMR